MTIDLRSGEIFEHELLNPLRGHELTELEKYIASLLLDANAEKPIGIEEIIVHVELQLHQSLSDRRVKQIIRALRKEHAFPILANRQRPSGYWWAGSKEEMEEFLESFLSQPRDEFHTASRMVKANYPELAGQLKLDLD